MGLWIETIRRWERPLGALWGTLALGMAYFTWEDYLSEPDASFLVWISLHVIAAVLFFIRTPPIGYSTSALAYPIALASVNYYLLYDFSISSQGWSATVGQYLTIFASVLCVGATLSLGRCFGILPAYRGVQTRFAYRLIRHPIYGNYILLDLGILLLHPAWENVLVFVVAILLYVVRIRFEEDVLSQAPAYLKYKKQVKYKLIPFVY